MISKSARLTISTNRPSAYFGYKSKQPHGLAIQEYTKFAKDSRWDWHLISSIERVSERNVKTPWIITNNISHIRISMRLQFFHKVCIVTRWMLRNPNGQCTLYKVTTSRRQTETIMAHNFNWNSSFSPKCCLSPQLGQNFIGLTVSAVQPMIVNSI